MRRVVLAEIKGDDIIVADDAQQDENGDPVDINVAAIADKLHQMATYITDKGTGQLDLEVAGRRFKAQIGSNGRGESIVFLTTV